MPRKLYLWKCPNGKHRAVRAPGRPRLDDTRRYCLKCSEETGRLTERVAPAVERKREQKAATRKRKAATKARRAAKKAKVRRERTPTVWPDTLHKQWTAMVCGDVLQRLHTEGVKVQVVKARTRASTGRCAFKSKTIVIKAGTFEPGGMTQLAYQAARFLAHLGGRRDDASVAQVLYRFARETWGPTFVVTHHNEPDLAETMRELATRYSRMVAQRNAR